MAFERAAQGMQLPAGSVHIFRALGVVQRKELLPESFGMTRLDSCLGPGPKELLDTFVPEAL